MSENKFCLILNKLEKFYDFLPDIFKTFFNSKNTCFNDHVLAQVVLFIGNYGFTPFGFHRDGDEELAIHFNIGPNNKELYTLDANTFLSLSGATETCSQYEELLPHATKHLIPPGSAFILPTKFYHIGNTDQLTFDLVLLISRFKFMDFLKNAVEIKIENTIINGSMVDFISEKKYFYNKFDIDTAYMNFTSNFKEDDFDLYYLFIAYLDYILSSYSNANYQSSHVITKNYTANEIKDKRIYIVKPFKLLAYEYGDNRLAIFSRRKKINTTYNEAILNLNEHLNNNKIIDVKEFLTSHSDQEKNVIKYLDILIMTGTVDAV